MLEFNVRVHIVQTSPIVSFCSGARYSLNSLCLCQFYFASILSLLLTLSHCWFHVRMKIGKVIEGLTGSIHFTRSSIIRRDKYTQSRTRTVRDEPPQSKPFASSYHALNVLLTLERIKSFFLFKSNDQQKEQKKYTHCEHTLEQFIFNKMSFLSCSAQYVTTTRGCSVHCTEFC